MSYFITENQVRLYQVNENQYYLTEFDLDSVALHHETSVCEALEKIAEAHSISTDNIEIVTEALISSRYETKSIDNIIQKTEDDIEKYEYKLKLNPKDEMAKSRLAMLKSSLERAKEQARRTG